MSFSYLDSFVEKSTQELPLCGEGLLTKVAMEENKWGKLQLNFYINDAPVYVNIANESATESQKKGCAFSLINTLYRLVGAKNSEKLNDVLIKAQSFVGYPVKYVQKEYKYFSSQGGVEQIGKSLSSITWIDETKLNNEVF